MREVSINVNGQLFLGWKDIQVSRSLDALSATFALSYIDAWNFEKLLGPYKTPKTGPQKWYLQPGDRAEVYIDDELVITGYIDEVEASMSDTDRGFRVLGRDITCDLVDCSASATRAREFKNLTIPQIASQLIEPFGIELSIEGPLSGTKFRRVAVDYGQTVFDLLDNLCRQRGVLLTTSAKGELVITVPANNHSTVSIQEGVNLKSATFSVDHRRRFSDYVCFGQASGDAFFFGESARKIKGSATDESVTRHRPRVVIAERDVSRAEAIVRSQWEAKYNAAKGTALQATVNGWRQGPSKNDPLWKINSLTEVTIPSLAVNGELLIDSVRFRLDERGGEITEMTLTRADAWVPNPIVKPEESMFLELGRLVTPR